jgi:hypothetical protein
VTFSGFQLQNADSLELGSRQCFVGDPFFFLLNAAIRGNPLVSSLLPCLESDFFARSRRDGHQRRGPFVDAPPSRFELFSPRPTSREEGIVMRKDEPTVRKASSNHLLQLHIGRV